MKAAIHPDSVAETEASPAYRPVSGAAVLTLCLGFISAIESFAATDLHPAVFAFVPTVGAVIGFRALGAIRRYELAGRGLATAGLFLCVTSLLGGFSGRAYRFATEVPDGYTRLTYDVLQPKGVETFPDTAKAFDGQRVFMKGYMYPTSQMSDITEFVLCRDNGSCCFGGQPKLTDMVQVRLPRELAVDYGSGVRAVAGTFRVSPETSSQGLGGIVYHMDGELVR